MTVSVLQRVACSWVKWEPGQLESPSPPVLTITPCSLQMTVEKLVF